MRAGPGLSAVALPVSGLQRGRLQARCGKGCLGPRPGNSSAGSGSQGHKAVAPGMLHGLQP